LSATRSVHELAWNDVHRDHHLGGEACDEAARCPTIRNTT